MVVARWYAGNGDADSAFTLFNEASKIGPEIVSYEIFVSFVKRKDIDNARRVINQHDDGIEFISNCIKPNDIESVVAGLLFAPSGLDLALSFVRSLSNAHRPERIRKFWKSIALLDRAGVDVQAFLRSLPERNLKPLGIDTFLALRTFVDAERAWVKAVDPLHRAPRDREAWRKEIKDSIGNRTDLEEAIEYRAL